MKTNFDKESFSNLSKKIKHKDSYVNDKITEIGDFINKADFLKEANQEFLFSLCKNPFLLMVPIAEILQEEEAGKVLANTINKTLEILKINTNYNKEVKPELLDRNNLIKISAVLADSIDNVEYENKENAQIFKSFLDGIEFQYAHKNYPNNKNKKELSVLDKESSLVKILDSFNHNLQNSDFIKEIEEKNAASLLEEIELQNTEKSISKKNKKPNKAAANKKEIYSDKNSDNKNDEALETQNISSLPINEGLKSREEQKQNSLDQTKKGKTNQTFHLYPTNRTKNKKISESNISLTPNTTPDTNITFESNVAEANIIPTKNNINNYEIDYKTLKNFLGNKNFPEKPSNNPSNVTSINLTGKSFNNGIEKI